VRSATLRTKPRLQERASTGPAPTTDG
jgi:hypothetical protein